MQTPENNPPKQHQHDDSIQRLLDRFQAQEISRRELLKGIAASGVALSSLGLPLSPALSQSENIRAGFIYVGPIGDAGWTYAHDVGRKKLEEKFPNLDTHYIESVPEGAGSSSVIESMARRGFDVIFGTSFGYMNPMHRLATRYPDVIFEHCSGYKTRDNMGTYFGKIYQSRYLTGLVAGNMTEENLLGYVAAHPIPEVIRGINAFTIGVREANPEATVKVNWTNTWYDPALETEAAYSLLDLGADVIAQHQDTPGPQQAAQDRGAYSVGYNVDMAEFAPKAHLTAPVWNWIEVYEPIIQWIQDGTWETHEIWWGLDKDLVDIAPFGPMVPGDVQDYTNNRKQQIIDGEFEVFSGPLSDQEGKVQIPEGESMSGDEIWTMDWFVEGVEGKL